MNLLQDYCGSHTGQALNAAGAQHSRTCEVILHDTNAHYT